jgi:hypothetical protein
MTSPMSDSDFMVEWEQAYASGEVPFWPGATGHVAPVAGGVIHYVEMGTSPKCSLTSIEFWWSTCPDTAARR